MHATLASESFALVWRLKPWFIIFTVINTVLHSVCDLLLNYNYIWQWVAMRIVLGTVFNYISQRMTDDLYVAVTKEWITFTYESIGGATHYSRHNIGKQVFIEQKDKAIDAIWGFIRDASTILPNVIGALLSCAILFPEQPLLMIMCFIICAMIWFVSLAWTKWFSKEFKRINKLFTTAGVDVRMQAPIFQEGSIPAKNMIDIELKPLYESIPVDRSFNMFTTCKMFGLDTLYTIVPQFKNHAIAAMLISRLIECVNKILQLEMRYTRASAPYDALCATLMLMEKAAPIPDATDDPIEIVIESVEIIIEEKPIMPETKCEPHWFDRVNSASEWLMQWFTNTNGYVIVSVDEPIPLSVSPARPGWNWKGQIKMDPGIHLIKGVSGGGKSTLINGITGKIPGVKIQGEWQPDNLRKRFALFYQTLKTDMPIFDNTVSKLFPGSDEIDEIRPVATACCIWDKIKELGHNKIITQRLSGGEQTRITLAIVCWQAIRDKLPYIVLDEPEQGLDPGLAYRVANNIFQLFPDKIIIVVTHLERAEEMFQWRTRTTVSSSIESTTR